MGGLGGKGGAEGLKGGPGPKTPRCKLLLATSQNQTARWFVPVLAFAHKTLPIFNCRARRRAAATNRPPTEPPAAADADSDATAGKLFDSATAAAAAASAQSALSNTLVNPCEVAAAVYRLNCEAPVAPVRVDGGCNLGRQLLQLLEARKLEVERLLDAAAATADSGPAVGGATASGPAVTLSSAAAAARGSSGAAAGVTATGLFIAAYPEAVSALGRAAQGLRTGRIKLWVVPFRALNPEGCPPQFYALGVPSSGSPARQRGFATGPSLDVFVALDTPTGGSWAAEVHSLGHLDGRAGDGRVTPSDELAQIAEALVHESYEADAKWQQGVSRVSAASSHLIACIDAG